MKARTYKKLLRLNQDEQERLRYLSKSTGLNQEQVLRKVLMDAPLLERPTADYIKMSRQIAALGNNLNQLAHIANASGKVSNTDLLTAKQMWKRCETARLCVGNGIITEKISTTLPPSALMKCVMQLLLQWTP